jgi:raffinose/stachyose/melibiose transport system permease protein
MAERLKQPSSKVLSWLILPGMILFCFAIIVPMAVALYYSFFDWRNITRPEWNSFGNYKELVKDPIFWKALINNLKLALYTLVGQIGIGYFLAFALVSNWVKFRKFHRVVMYFPAMISSIVLSFLWTLVFSNDYGMLNVILRAIGLENLATAWLSNPNIIVEVLAVPLIWQWFGYYTVIFLSAFIAIPSEVLEAARLDGATGLRLARHIYIPLTYPTLTVTVMLCLSGIMKTFDHILVMTNGGPGTASMVMALYAYNQTLVFLRLGYGTAIAMGIVVFSLIITLFTRLVMGGKRYE